MTIPPLTHHEILALIEPFARRGRQADLAHSDRLARRLVFKPRDHGQHRETLELDSATPGRHRLTRRLTLADGLDATLSIEGDDPSGLIAAIEAVAHQRQWIEGQGFVIALGLRLDASGILHLTHGTARAQGMTVSLAMPAHGSRSADLVLSTGLDDAIELPDDLLAVLGWDWSRLDRWTDRNRRRWTGTVRLRGRDLDADAEGKLQRAALQVAETLAEPPARFHERQWLARWVFAFRRSIPLLVCIALIVAALVFTKAGLSQDSVVRMLIFNAPPLMLVAFFCLRELPRIELPKWPRRSNAAAWRSAPADPATTR